MQNSEKHKNRLDLKRSGADLVNMDQPVQYTPAVELVFTFTQNGYGFPVSGFNFVHVYLRDLNRKTGDVDAPLCVFDVDQTDLYKAKSQADLVSKLLNLGRFDNCGPAVKLLVTYAKLNTARRTGAPA